MRLAAMLLAITTTSACFFGDDDGDPSSYVAITQYEAAYKDASCTYLAACGHFPDKASCLAAELQLGLAVEPNLVAAVVAGRVRYLGGNAKRCIDALAMRSCDRTSESARVTPPECNDLYQGVGGSGDPCFFDYECISGFCSGGSGGDSCFMGQCVGDTPQQPEEPAQIGESCFSFSGCVAGAYCDTQTSICTALKSSGATCTQNEECGYGLACVGTTGARTCGALPGVGQSCATDGLCRDDGTYCDFNTGMCRAVGLPPTTCSSSTQCSTYYPCNFTTGQCTRGPSVGMPCDSSNRCFDAGTFCDFTTSTCAALRSNGAACNSDNECQSDYCEFGVSSTGTCEEPQVCF